MHAAICTQILRTPHYVLANLSVGGIFAVTSGSFVCDAGKPTPLHHHRQSTLGAKGLQS